MSQLPPEFELDEIASGNAFGKISDIKNIVNLGDKTRFDFDEIAELDQLSSNIKNISSDTLFTKVVNQENRRKSDEETPKKSAFDILEDFVNQNETLNQNKLASESETPINVIEAKIIDIATAEGILNAPEIDDEYMEEATDKAEILASDENIEETTEAHDME